MVIGLNEYCSDLVFNRQIQILESYMYEEDILSEAMDFVYDTMLESSVLLEATTNRDMLSEFKKGVSETKGFIKEGKKHLRNGDKESAKKSYSQAISRLDDLEKYLRNINDFSTGSKLLGTISSILISLSTFLIFNILNKKIRNKYLDTEYSKIDRKILDIEKDIKNDNDSIQYFYSRGNKRMTEDYIKSRNGKYVEIDKLNAGKVDVFTKADTDTNKRSIIAVLLKLIKTTKEIIQVSKNGGTEKGFNLLRNKLIVYISDMKTVLKLLYK